MGCNCLRDCIKTAFDGALKDPVVWKAERPAKPLELVLMISRADLGGILGYGRLDVELKIYQGKM